MKLNEIMTSLLETIEPGAPVHEAAIKMKATALSALPVVLEERIVGIVTEHDLVVYALFEGRLSKAVRDVMSWHPVCLEETCSPEEALDELGKREATHLVVTATGRPVGVVTITELLLSTTEKSSSRPPVRLHTSSWAA